MASAVVAIQWDNYAGSAGTTALFDQDPVTFNSRQDRLHTLSVGDTLWIVARCPDDRQYYFVARLPISAIRKNDAKSAVAQRFGEFSVVVSQNESVDMGRSCPADDLLRALTFENNRPIKYGANIGQSLQTMRILSALDEHILEETFDQLCVQKRPDSFQANGLWTKCDRVFSDYFVVNWRERREPLAFLLYDPPPTLPSGAPVFIHSDKHLRLIARYLSGLHIAGHKKTAEAVERIDEREWVWERFREQTINPPKKADFDTFWDGQSGVRGVFVMDHVLAVDVPVQFRDYGRALEWGYPRGVGYRYLSAWQCLLLTRQLQLNEDQERFYLAECCVGMR